VNPQDPFTISTDVQTGSLTAVLRGLWDMQTARDYGEELARAAGTVERRSRKSTWVIDLRALDVQPQDVAAYMTGIIADLTSRFDAAVAVVSPRALVSMQSRRIAQRPDHRFFATLDEANAWLQHQR